MEPTVKEINGWWVAAGDGFGAMARTQRKAIKIFRELEDRYKPIFECQLCHNVHPSLTTEEHRNRLAAPGADGSPPSATGPRQHFPSSGDVSRLSASRIVSEGT